MVVKLAELTERYFFVDPASGKKLALKKTRANSAIVGIAPDAWGRIFVLVAWADRCSTDTLTNKIIEFNASFKPTRMGVEANALQSLYGDMIAREARMKDIKLPLSEIEQNTKVDKDFRIRAALQPVIGEGRLFLQPHQHELRAELQQFPMSAKKDLVDALASAVAMVPRRALKRQRQREEAARIQYLRDSGAPDRYIEEIEQEVFGSVGGKSV